MCRSGQCLSSYCSCKEVCQLADLLLHNALACRGKLIYVDKDYKQDFTCSPPCRFACQDFSVGGTSGGLASDSAGITLCGWAGCDNAEIAELDINNP